MYALSLASSLRIIGKQTMTATARLKQEPSDKICQFNNNSVLIRSPVYQSLLGEVNLRR